MGARSFSDRDRPVHLGPYPLERLAQRDSQPDLSAVAPMQALHFHRPDTPHSIVNAMGEYQAMLDAIRDCLINRARAVILNPFLGPRLKSGVVTTDLPMTHDRPIDFRLQRFYSSCNKFARKCPSGAITTGLKLMFNGYEIWKSYSQKCATYRISTPGGMCKCGLVAGDDAHRDCVLSRAQREGAIILCQSRAATADGVITADL